MPPRVFEACHPQATGSIRSGHAALSRGGWLSVLDPAVAWSWWCPVVAWRGSTKSQRQDQRHALTSVRADWRVPIDWCDHLLAFDPTGDVLAFSRKDRAAVTLWPVTGGRTRTLTARGDPPRAVLWAPDGGSLYAVSSSRGVLEWDVRARLVPRLLRGAPGAGPAAVSLWFGVTPPPVRVPSRACGHDSGLLRPRPPHPAEGVSPLGAGRRAAGRSLVRRPRLRALGPPLADPRRPGRRRPREGRAVLWSRADRPSRTRGRDPSNRSFRRRSHRRRPRGDARQRPDRGDPGPGGRRAPPALPGRAVDRTPRRAPPRRGPVPGRAGSASRTCASCGPATSPARAGASTPTGRDPDLRRDAPPRPRLLHALRRQRIRRRPSREVRLPDGTGGGTSSRREDQGRRDARRVPRPVRLQPARRELCARFSPRCRASCSGTTTRSPTTGTRARSSTTPATARRGSTCWPRARPPRLPRVHADRERRRPSRAHLPAHPPRPACSTSSSSTSAATGAPTPTTAEPARAASSWARAQTRWLLEGLGRVTRDLEGDRRRHAARAGRAGRHRPPGGRRATGDAGPPLGRELEHRRRAALAQARGIRNIVWLTADVHYTAAHHYSP